MTAGEDTPRDAASILQDLNAKSNMIAHQRKRRDSGKFTSVNDAITLQRLERERGKLVAQLPALRLVP